MKKITQFDTKMKAYSAMALCFAGAGVANAQIVYTDVNPDITVTTVPDSCIIDFNNDATPDYIIKRFDWSGNPANSAVIMPPAVNNGIMATMGATVPYVSALAAGAAIDGTVTTWITNDGVDPQLMKFGLASTYSGTTYGHFNDGADHFIGCEFMIGADVHYGWVRVSCASGGASGTIKDYAYNTAVGGAITAGQMAGIDDVVAVESNIYSFNKNVHFNFSSSIQGEINVYNSLGELILNDNIEGQKTVIDMSAQASGIYMIKVASNKGDFVKKISL
jgi:hypothetical protein